MRTDWVLCWTFHNGEWCLLFVLGSLVFNLAARRADYLGIDPT